ncbi:MAG: glyoxalase [Lachnospiraceae bacterium]|nr:glyoxalase [Lachnospiraceae bacterium]
MYDDICVEKFLEHQLQLFPEPVAETDEEALYFLEDVCAVVCDSKKDVINYMKDMLDVSGMSEEEILASEEVFDLEDGRYLIVEG